VGRIANVYAAPSTRARRLTRLHWLTEDGFPEVYVLLRAHWARNGLKWVKLRIPARPNGQVGWVEANALGAPHVTHQRVVVDRRRLRLYFYDFGRLRWSAPVGVGAPGTPTPPGYFWVRERFKISDPGSGYYPYAFGTADYSTLSEWPRGGVVGIHGPYFNQGGIPGYISHGCVRLRVADDRWLGTHLKVGTPVRVL
jgi:lipoprotein-anchoring transpeptidase ErfK/SrfK